MSQTILSIHGRWPNLSPADEHVRGNSHINTAFSHIGSKEAELRVAVILSTHENLSSAESIGEPRPARRSQRQARPNAGRSTPRSVFALLFRKKGKAGESFTLTTTISEHDKNGFNSPAATALSGAPSSVLFPENIEKKLATHSVSSCKIETPTRGSG
jgi:hypothetical protein